MCTCTEDRHRNKLTLAAKFFTQSFINQVTIIYLFIKPNPNKTPKYTIGRKKMALPLWYMHYLFLMDS